MTDTLFVPMVGLNELCGRARSHYLERRGIDDPCWRQEVQCSIPFRDLKSGADGWVHISNLTDPYYQVLWHPETDKLRLKGPDR